MVLNFALLLQFMLQERSLKILELKVDPKQLKIDIKAGTDGFWGWFMRTCGLDTKSGYAVDSTGCRRTTNGFVNVSRTYAPLYNLSAAVYFLVKPIGALIAGLFFSITTMINLFTALSDRQGPSTVGLMMAALFGIITVVCLAKFFLGERTAVIGVMTNAGTIVSIKLKVKAPDFRTFQQAIAIIETVVARANGGSGSTSSTWSESEGGQEALDELEDADDQLEEFDESPQKKLAPARGLADEKRVILCPHCDAKLRLNSSIIGSRIRCPSCQEPFVAKQ